MTEPRTAAGRDLEGWEPTIVNVILAIEAEARAAALDAVAEALGDCEVGWGESLTTDLRQSEVRAAIDALREHADKV